MLHRMTQVGRIHGRKGIRATVYLEHSLAGPFSKGRTPLARPDYLSTSVCISGSLWARRCPGVGPEGAARNSAQVLERELRTAGPRGLVGLELMLHAGAWGPGHQGMAKAERCTERRTRSPPRWRTTDCLYSDSTTAEVEVARTLGEGTGKQRMGE